MALRAIEAILPPDNLHFVGDGFRVYGILGRREPLTMKRMSPFLLMDYAPVHYFPPNNGLLAALDLTLIEALKQSLLHTKVKLSTMIVRVQVALLKKVASSG